MRATVFLGRTHLEGTRTDGKYVTITESNAGMVDNVPIFKRHKTGEDVARFIQDIRKKGYIDSIRVFEELPVHVTTDVAVRFGDTQV